jgi:hydroxymethylbilane synthase
VRLGLAQRIASHFAPEETLPCAGQGALGIEIRSDAAALHDRLAGLIHTPTWLAVQAERAVSRALGGSCSMPLAAHAAWQGSTLTLQVVLGNAQVPLAPLLRVKLQEPVATDVQARKLGDRAAQALRDAGADAYLGAAAEHARLALAPPGD